MTSRPKRTREGNAIIASNTITKKKTYRIALPRPKLRFGREVITERLLVASNRSNRLLLQS
jgi:hypothetical protein